MGNYKANEEKLNDCNTSNIWYVIHYFSFVIQIYLVCKNITVINYNHHRAVLTMFS